MAARQPFWKSNRWKSIGFYSYTQEMCCCNLDLVLEASNNSNLYKKKSTRSKLTLYPPIVENMMAHILWWLAIIFMLTFSVKPIFQLLNIQYSSKSRSISVLGEEGLIWAWWYSASARPTFQSSVAVYNHAHWSRITTGFFWIVYFDNG